MAYFPRILCAVSVSDYLRSGGLDCRLLHADKIALPGISSICDTCNGPSYAIVTFHMLQAFMHFVTVTGFVFVLLRPPSTL